MADYSIENQFQKTVAGIDEAGRGPLAGPVVAAAVIVHAPEVMPQGITDSKKLSAKQRSNMFEGILQACHVGVGRAEAEEIDRMNILQASLLAMRRAVDALPVKPYVALVDGNQCPGLSCQTQLVIKGDSKSISIAAASIIAKVTRDHVMDDLHEEYPFYDWANNAGYGTKKHVEALRQYGVSPYHRKSFSPVREALLQKAFDFDHV